MLHGSYGSMNFKTGNSMEIVNKLHRKYKTTTKKDHTNVELFSA